MAANDERRVDYVELGSALVQVLQSIGLSIVPSEQAGQCGSCGECRWWAKVKREGSEDYGECNHPRAFFKDLYWPPASFGCNLFASKEGE